MAIQFSEINDDAQAQVTVNGKAAVAESPVHGNTLLAAFIKNQTELESHKNGKPVVVDGHTLSIPNVVAVARYGAHATLDTSPATRERVDASQNAIDKKLADGLSVYGLSTGYGGSADTRTNDHLILGKSLLQHQHSGILPSSNAVLPVLPLSDPMSNSSMPESWVRAAMLIRMNSLIRGHSGVRWKFIEALGDLLENNVTPVVPLRGSISASGDLSPLSYVAGTLIGNPGIRVFSGPAMFGSRQVKPAPIGLEEAGLEPLRFFPKEHLGLLNGTAFSAAVATLALNDAVHIALLAQVTTAMGTEALIGTQGSYTPFIHDVARPHRGQIESARIIHTLLEDSKFASQGEEKEMTIEEDYGTLRQDRYALRTAPQFMGPQLEDILSALDAVTQECNSTTDNPLIDGATGNVHHGGNFQAMAITNPMERTRLSLHHFGKLIFAQLTELLNPAFNRGLPPSLAASDPSVNYFAKGVDIASAAYVSELGYLANPVSTHIQSAEMHNQSVNSLALISARATITSLEVLTMLVSNYLYVLCQALDLRTLQAQFQNILINIIKEEITAHLSPLLPSEASANLHKLVIPAVLESLDNTTTKDAVPRLQVVAAAASAPLIDAFVSHSSFTSSGDAISAISTFRATVAARSAAALIALREEFLTPEADGRGRTPASAYVAPKTKPIYEFIRRELGIRMHGWENYNNFDESAGLAFGERTIGGDISLIYEAIRDGQLQNVIVGLFEA